MKLKLPWKEMTVFPTCKCWFERQEQSKKEEQKYNIIKTLRIRGFQIGKYADMRLSRFRRDNLETDIVPTVNNYIDSVDLKNRNWLYLHGECGLGKTFIAIAAARQIALSRLWNPALFRWTEYCSLIQQSWQDRKIKFDWNLGRKAQILVLDDIDKRAATPWALGELYDILNFRDINELPTIITANRSILELSSFWNQNKEIENVSRAIISRILGQVLKIIPFKGKDYRLYE